MKYGEINFLRENSILFTILASLGSAFIQLPMFESIMKTDVGNSFYFLVGTPLFVSLYLQIELIKQYRKSEYFKSRKYTLGLGALCLMILYLAIFWGITSSIVRAITGISLPYSEIYYISSIIAIIWAINKFR